ncbi:Clp protease, partial [Nocardia colli]
GQTVFVDVEGWDGEGTGEDAKFTFTGKTKLTKADDKGDEKPEVVLTGAAEGTAAEASGE